MILMQWVRILEMLKYGVGIPTAIVSAYYLYKHDFNPTKAFSDFSDDIYRLRYGNFPTTPAYRNSQFSTGLSKETAALLGAHFLQTDLDKNNGVTRNDIIALLVEAGFDEKTYSAQITPFIQRGRGEYMAIKRNSGCSIQEAVEVVEAVVNAAEAKRNADEEALRTHDAEGKPIENPAPKVPEEKPEGWVSDFDLLLRGHLQKVTPPSTWNDHLITPSITPVFSHVPVLKLPRPAVPEEENQLLELQQHLEDMKISLQAMEAKPNMNSKDKNRLRALKAQIEDNEEMQAQLTNKLKVLKEQREALEKATRANGEPLKNTDIMKAEELAAELQSLNANLAKLKEIATQRQLTGREQSRVATLEADIAAVTEDLKLTNGQRYWM